MARLRLRIDLVPELGPHGAIGPGKIALLEAIDKTRSITKAAKACGMSYTRAWSLIEAINGCFRKPAVLAGAGGAFPDVVGGTEVVAGREARTRSAQDHHPHGVVLFGEFERQTEFDEHPPVLRVALLRAVERDDGDPAVLADLVGDVVEMLHECSLPSPRVTAADAARYAAAPQYVHSRYGKYRL